jgi:hypothetical protein
MPLLPPSPLYPGMRIYTPTHLWLDVIPKKKYSQVEPLQNLCLLNLKKHNKFKILIENFKNNNVTIEDKFLLNLFRNIISQVGIHKKDYLFCDDVEKCINYGFDVLKFNILFAESLYENKFNKNTINILKNNMTYKLYKYNIKQIIPILKNLKTHFNISNKHLNLMKTNNIKIIIKNQQDTDEFNKFLLKMIELWPFKKLLCLNNLFTGEINIVLNFDIRCWD